jgi:hypothetical protein
MYYSYSSGHGRVDFIFYLLVGGPIVLMWGLRKLNEKRLIENIPVSRVRSAAMGLVELQGMAKPHKPQKAPLSNMDACWWNCRVEELRSNGKSSSWVTIKQVGSNDLFYLEDPTGRVLVNPLGAELHVLSVPYPLNASTRTQMAPVLNSWGINDLNWIGGEKPLRVIEELIPESAPLFVMGELITLGNVSTDLKERFMARLRAIKADPAKMAEADLNHDGVVDADEWAAFEAKQEQEFNQEEMLRQAQMPNQETMLVKMPQNSPFVVSVKDEQELVSSFAWVVLLGIFGGIALSGTGTWLALALDWNPFFVIGLLGVGCAFGFCVKSLNMTFGRG